MFAGRRSTTTTFVHSSAAEESPWRRFPTMMARITEAGRRSRQKESTPGTVGRSVSCFAMGASVASAVTPLSPCCLSPVTQLRVGMLGRSFYLRRFSGELAATTNHL